MTTENQAFEVDVSRIKSGDFPSIHVGLFGGLSLVAKRKFAEFAKQGERAISL